MGEGGSGLLLPIRWEGVQGAGVTSQETSLSFLLPRVLGLGPQVGTGPSSWELSREKHTGQKGQIPAVP